MPLDLKKKLGPLSRGAWLGVGGGIGLAYILWRRHTAAAADTTPLPNESTSGGTSIPGGESSTTGGVTYSTYADWLQAAISAATQQGLSYADAYNGINTWLNGGCVGQNVYNAISYSLQSVGLPTGYSSSGAFPALTVCPTPVDGGSGQDKTTPPPDTTTTTPPPTNKPTGGPPSLSAALSAAIHNNGESVVDTVFDSTNNTWLYLTNKGGVYALDPSGQQGGATYYGSYLGLPASATQSANGPRSFSTIRVNPDGSYTLVATDGATYTFGAGPGEARTG